MEVLAQFADFLIDVRAKHRFRSPTRGCLAVKRVGEGRLKANIHESAAEASPRALMGIQVSGFMFGFPRDIAPAHSWAYPQ